MPRNAFLFTFLFVNILATCYASCIIIMLKWQNNFKVGLTFNHRISTRSHRPNRNFHPPPPPYKFELFRIVFNRLLRERNKREKPNGINKAFFFLCFQHLRHYIVCLLPSSEIWRTEKQKKNNFFYCFSFSLSLSVSPVFK